MSNKFGVYNNYNERNPNIEYLSPGWCVTDPYEDKYFNISNSGTIYRILLDGEDIYNPFDEELTLLNPILEIEVNEPGTLEFTMPSIHLFYNSIVPFTSFIEVYEEEDLIWFGRPLDIETDFYKQKKVYCEGALGFFNDSIMDEFGTHRGEDEESAKNNPEITSVDDLTSRIIDAHNGCLRAAPMNSSYYTSNGPHLSGGNSDYLNSLTIPDLGLIVIPEIDINKFCFELGNISELKNIEEPQSGEGWHICGDIIKEFLIDGYGYYLVPRRTNNTNYLDLYDDYPLINSVDEYSQPVEFGLNLLDISFKFSGTGYCTSVAPFGPTIQAYEENDDNSSDSNSFSGHDPWLEEYSDKYPYAADPDTDRSMSVAPMNSLFYDGYVNTIGKPIVDSEAVKLYGRIIHIETFNDVKSRTELVERAKKYLEDTQFNALTIECSATDLHRQNTNYASLKLGMVIHIKSNPHLIDRDFPISKMTIKLDNAAKQITLGTVPRKELTKLKEKKQSDRWIGDRVAYSTLTSKDPNKVYFVTD